jgi:hypothetical protein
MAAGMMLGYAVMGEDLMNNHNESVAAARAARNSATPLRDAVFATTSNKIPTTKPTAVRYCFIEHYTREADTFDSHVSPILQTLQQERQKSTIPHLSKGIVLTKPSTGIDTCTKGTLNNQDEEPYLYTGTLNAGAKQQPPCEAAPKRRFWWAS